MGHDRYTAIVIGAGTAGTTAAYICAKNNISVALIERGEYPGSKNMFGGVIYREATASIIPAFWKKAPIERAITTDMLWFLDQNSAVKMGFTGQNFAKPPYNKFSVIKPRFDKWFAEQAIKAGAHLITSSLVTDFIYEKIGFRKKKVSGIILEDGRKIHADVVILAEGAIPKLAIKAGLQDDLHADSLILYVKELLSLPESVIEARFNLEKNEGANIGMVGFPTTGAIGKGGIWTNKDTISIIAGAYLNQIVKKGLNPYQLLTRFKKHPLVKRLIEGAKPVDYLSHTIPKAGGQEVPTMYDHGLLATGDTLMIVGGQGTVFAMLTGKAAAETVIQASAKDNFTKKTLASYVTKINNSFIMQNNMAHKETKNYYQNFSDTDLLITKTLNKIGYEFFSAGMDTHQEKRKKIREHLKTIQPLRKNIADILYGLQHWRVF